MIESNLITSRQYDFLNMIIPGTESEFQQMDINFYAKRIMAVSGLIFGSILLDTLPIWLSELAEIYQMSADDIGLLATVILLGAGAACLVHSFVQHWAFDLLFALLAVVLLSLAGTRFDISQQYILLAGVLVGWSMGTVIANGLEGAFARPDTLDCISLALSAGLLVSLVIIIINAAGEVPVIGQIAFCAFLASCTMIIGSFSAKGKNGQSVFSNWEIRWQELLYLPFFISMGGLWAFVEVYGDAQSIPYVKPILAFSMIVSAFGSAAANMIRNDKREFWLFLGLFISAASGAWLYLSQSLAVYAIMLLINSFFLFLFLPLYLFVNSLPSGTSNAQVKAAIYLFGFALGGVFGGYLLANFGHGVFVSTILISALPPGIILWSKSRNSPIRG